MKVVCPDDEMIADYLEGRLSEKERFRMEKHLSDCETCSERLIIASTLMKRSGQAERETVLPEVTEAAVRLVQGPSSVSRDTGVLGLRDSVRDLPAALSDFLAFRPWGEWLSQPVRGSKRRLDKNLIVIRKTFKGFDAQLEIERIGSDKCNIRVALPGLRPVGIGMRITLRQGDREVSSQPMEYAFMTFEDIPFGRYRLVFDQRGVLVGTYAFEIAETGCGER
jgi:hypothetical protein